MTEEDLKISELGAYTNNSMNREGLKKLVAKVNSGGGTVDAYTKAETDALLDDKQDVLTAGTNISISEENVISATDTVYTAGTGISISDQNVISALASGGDWEEVIGDANFKALFEIDESTYALKSLHDIYITSLSTASVDRDQLSYFIPKNVSISAGQYTYNKFISPAFNHRYDNNNNTYTYLKLVIGKGSSSSSVNFYFSHQTVTFTISDNNIVVSGSVSNDSKSLTSYGVRVFKKN